MDVPLSLIKLWISIIAIARSPPNLEPIRKFFADVSLRGGVAAEAAP